MLTDAAAGETRPVITAGGLFEDDAKTNASSSLVIPYLLGLTVGSQPAVPKRNL